MDIEDFWNDIIFKPLYKEKGMWVLGAHVDSGIAVQLMVISSTRQERLVDMDWKFIYGLEPDGQIPRVQYFDYPAVLRKVLICRGRDYTETKYMHEFEPYIVIKKHDQRLLEMSQYPDKAKLMEILSQPGFTVKRI